MNVSLTPELETLVNEKVKSGDYNSASEVVREALRLLKEQDELKQIRRAELRRKVIKGAEDIRAGRYTELKTPEDFDNFADQIITEGRQKLAQKKKGQKVRKQD
jgi:antitoxin ParD1/3/4